MDAMANTIRGWAENPVKFACSHGVNASPATEVADPGQLVHILIVEGFLLYSYKSLMDVVQKEEVGTVRSQIPNIHITRQYTVPDPLGLFGVCVFYLSVSILEFKLSYLDGLKSKEELYSQVYEDIWNTVLNRL
uniref:Muscle-specific beta 1 integrin binding protein n=1 Tax=Salmo trutta TaxID=8032 RepID=A0A673W0K0_SALTR